MREGGREGGEREGEGGERESGGVVVGSSSKQPIIFWSWSQLWPPSATGVLMCVCLCVCVCVSLCVCAGVSLVSGLWFRASMRVPDNT